MSTPRPAQEPAVPSPPSAEEPAEAAAPAPAGPEPEDDGAPGPTGDADTPADDDGAPVPDGPVHRVADVADPSRVRRAPRYGRFAVAGFLLAVVLSFGLTFVPGAEDGLGRRDLFFLLLLSLGSAGIVLGLLVALWTDRRSLRRRR